MNTDLFGIWFGNDGAHASLEVPFELEGEADYDVAEVVIDLYVGKWERGQRTFDIEAIVLTEFGRAYHFELEELLPDPGMRERFMEELEVAHDDYLDDCRADAAADY